jgi:hypothetical protein
MDLDNLGPAPKVDSSFRIVRVSGDDQFEIWMEITEDGRDPAPLFREAYPAHGYGHEAFSQRFLGY